MNEFSGPLPVIKASEYASNKTTLPQTEEKKGRGRPKGSKNKPKGSKAGSTTQTSE